MIDLRFDVFSHTDVLDLNQPSSNVVNDGVYTLLSSVETLMVEETLLSKRIVVDGSNVAYNFRGNSFHPLLDNLLFAWESLVELGAIPTVIVDYTLCRQIDRHKELKLLVDQELIHKVPRELDADCVILDLAFKLDAYILSNDRYFPYWEDYGEKAIEQKRIPFKIIESRFYYVLPAN